MAGLAEIDDVYLKYTISRVYHAEQLFIISILSLIFNSSCTLGFTQFGPLLFSSLTLLSLTGLS